MFKCDVFLDGKNLGQYFLPRVPVSGDTLVIDTSDYYVESKVVKVKVFCFPRDDSVVANVYCEE